MARPNEGLMRPKKTGLLVDSFGSARARALEKKRLPLAGGGHPHATAMILRDGIFDTNVDVYRCTPEVIYCLY